MYAEKQEKMWNRIEEIVVNYVKEKRSHPRSYGEDFKRDVKQVIKNIKQGDINTVSIEDALLFFDALGVYDKRDDELDEAYGFFGFLWRILFHANEHRPHKNANRVV